MMLPMLTLRAHALPLAILLALCALAASFKLGHLGITPNSDYQSYIATAQVLSGLPAQAYPERLLKPLAPLVVAAAAPALGFPAAFVLEVVLFYFAFALAFYALAYAFLEDRWLALVAALFGALSYPMLRYGLDLYTETGAQFFYLLSLLLTLFYLRMPSRRLLLANALAIGIGFLWKEYSAVAGLAFALVLLFERGTLRRRAAGLGLLAFVALIPTVLVQLWVYAAYHYTYLSWYLQGGASGFATQFTLHNLAKSLAALLGLAWLLVPVGIWHLPELSAVQRRFLAMVIPASFAALLWGYVSSRLFYVMAPALVLLAVYGLARLPRWVHVLAVAVALIANFAALVLLTA